MEITVKDIFKMSLKMTGKNKRFVLIVFALLFILNICIAIHEAGDTPNEFLIAIIIVLVYILFVGSLAYFTEKIISESSNPPEYDYNWVFRKGIHEALFFTVYIVIEFVVYYGFDYIIDLFPDYDDILIIAKFLILGVITILPMAAMINVFLHDEKFKYGLKVKQLLHLILNLKTSYFITIVIIRLVIENIIFIAPVSQGFTLTNIIISILSIIIISFLYVIVQFISTLGIVISNKNQYRSQLLKKFESI